MPSDVVMPKLGLNMTEGLLVEWLKKEGDPVKKGDLLFSVETDKITTEAEANVDGVLAKILVPAGETVPVRTVVGLITAPGEILADEPDRPAARAAQAESPVARPAEAAAAPAASQPRGAVLASPIAKRMAAEKGIDLATVKGTSPDGRISLEDVERALVERTAVGTGKPAEGNEVKIEGVRAVIAERMLASSQKTAQVTLHMENDVSAMVAYRQKMKDAAVQHVPSFNAILASVTAKALKEYPYMNAVQDGNVIKFLEKVNMGMAVDTEAGLVVVVVPDADKKDPQAVQAELTPLIERALARKSQPDDLSGGTFTITNLGGFGVEGFTPIINPPEMAILGVGRIIEKLVIIDGKVAQRPMMTLSLTFDHRLVDGAPAARFMQAITEKLAALA
jgi:pyruvate dehydrogenase E2 component (dihydrolipoamide acetyltransferase)